MHFLQHQVFFSTSENMDIDILDLFWSHKHLFFMHDRMISRANMNIPARLEADILDVCNEILNPRTN
jgi:hypothetical protein